MKNDIKNLKRLLIFGSLFLFSCGDSGVKKYYETVKDTLHAKNKNIQDILRTAEDHEETDLAPGGGLDALSQDARDAVSSSEPAKSKLYPLQNEDCFVIDIESYKGKQPSGYFESGTILHTGLFSDAVYMVSQKDSIGEQRNPGLFKSDIERYLNRKYLVLVDCRYYYYPKQLNSSEFRAGHLIKKVSIYDIATKALADSYYLYATSGSKIRYSAGHPANFAGDMANNITGQLISSLFRSY